MAGKRTPASSVALGGVLAALAVVVMSLGTTIPIATYVCPMLCALLLQAVLKTCGVRIAWAWYGAVAILSLLLAPDKEAAAVFAFLGYYPIVKPRLDKTRLRWLWKGLLFNASVLVMYWLLLRVFGLAQVTEDFEDIGVVMPIVLLILGNVTFFLLDKLLEKRSDSDVWGLVGGGCKKWETGRQAIVREVYEELGLRIAPERFRKLAVYDNPGRIAAFRDGSIWRMVIVVYALELEEEQEMHISRESKDHRFFSREEIGNIEIAITHRDIVEDWFVKAICE